MDDLKTGDLILFNSQSKDLFSILSSMIRIGTQSNYTHIGMIIKDPSFIEPHLKGLYVWESGWEGEPDPQDNKVKLGVQITPLQEIIDSYKDGFISVRKINCDPKLFSNDKLKDIHNVVYKKPYDIMPLNWILALFRKDEVEINTFKIKSGSILYMEEATLLLEGDLANFAVKRKDLNYQRTNRFWCSALIGYIYTKCGILKSETDWSILRPSDFSIMCEHLKFEDDCFLDDKEIKIKH